MTEQELQIALAKMLPEKIYVDCEQGFNEEKGEYYDITERKAVYWNLCEQDSGKVRDTEWLHVCWLLLQNLEPLSRADYLNCLRTEVGCDKPKNKSGHALVSDFDLVVASWQQQATALIAVKGEK